MVDDIVDKPSTSVDPTSPSWARPVLTNARLAVEVFDGIGHFGMWQSEVLDVLFQQGLDIVIEEQRYAFSKETSSYKLWVALEEKFLKKNCHNKLFIKKRLFRFTYVPGTMMNDHITSFNQLVTDLMNMDEVFKDQDLALILLGSLPEDYELLETTLLNGKDDVSLSERDCPKLKTKDNHYKGKVVAEANVTKCDDEQSDLLLATSSTKNTSDVWLFDSACCHQLHRIEIGLNEDGTIVTLKGVHQDLALILLGSLPEDYELLETTLLNGKDDVSLSERDCPKLKTKDNHYKGKVVAEANVTKCDDEQSDLLLATSSTKNTSDVWLFDSACCHQLHRIEIGLNEDGTIVTLKGVRYSPKLKKNLISVGTLESKGFEVRAKDGVMTIISGVLVVMKGIHKINNTYHYKGRTVVGTVAAITDGDRNSKA
ncbi:hypothetical protein CTI12_AA612520 [Artemisia annua]|uniref:Retrovirus-related Pol polyprotein from transposon TNT 1-94-like beta-barrel domain-containing protein n=1 Tax=Artemisia annua TaxID=35608 RepID=A0A2U1KEA5_ARTAN|nr:hypothetical protein CTI12_AA612520 [Artemisia annua]